MAKKIQVELEAKTDKAIKEIKDVKAKSKILLSQQKMVLKM